MATTATNDIDRIGEEWISFFCWFNFTRQDDKFMSDIVAACNCDSIGGAGGGECEGKTDPAAGLQAGRCICKKNVGGLRCDRCKPGFFDLTSLPEGCKRE